MPGLCGMGDAYRADSKYVVRGFAKEERFMSEVRQADSQADMDIPTLFIGAGIGALAVFGTVLAIVMWG